MQYIYILQVIQSCAVSLRINIAAYKRAGESTKRRFGWKTTTGAREVGVAVCATTRNSAIIWRKECRRDACAYIYILYTKRELRRRYRKVWRKRDTRLVRTIYMGNVYIDCI